MMVENLNVMEMGVYVLLAVILFVAIILWRG
jgi:hypothetical protein